MKENMCILVTGGNGFIGSHCAVLLYEYLDSINFVINKKKVSILILDDLSNSYLDTFQKIIKLCQDVNKERDPNELMKFLQLNVLDANGIDELFHKQKEVMKEPIEYIIHFAATVYGICEDGKESDLQNPQNCYAMTKVSVEYLMKCQSVATPDCSFISLRYFNPAGAHKSGLIGDSPSTYPNNLFPFLQQVIIGNRPQINVFGNDYPTHDGTGIRDYIHISDLAEAHVATFKKCQELKGFHSFNIGTGKGFSVLEIIQAYAKANGKQIPYQITSRRAGDVAILQANVDKAHAYLEWSHKKNLEEMCKDSYNFILKNPDKQF